MLNLPSAFLECRQCGSLVDFSNLSTDDTRVLCSKCGYDFGRYKDVKDAAATALRQRSIDEIKKVIKQ